MSRILSCRNKTIFALGVSSINKNVITLKMNPENLLSCKYMANN